MTRKGCIIAFCLMAASTAQATDISGKELADKLFSDCDAALADPASVLALADITSEAPAMATTDGKVLSATITLTDAEGDFIGANFVTARSLPGGTAVSCMLTLYGNVVRDETRASLHDTTLANAHALIGEDAVTVGGAVGGPALLKMADAPTEVKVLASPDFPPSASVAIATSDGFTNVTVERFRAAP